MFLNHGGFELIEKGYNLAPGCGAEVLNDSAGWGKIFEECDVA